MRWTLTIIAILVLTLSAFVSLSDGRSSYFGIGVFACSVLLLFANIDRFTRFRASVSSIEAELHETVTEANATIAQMRAITELLGEAILWQASRVGRFWNPDTPAKTLEFERRVNEVFDQLGLGSEAKERAAQEVRDTTKRAFVSALLGGSSIEFVPASLVSERGDIQEGPPPAPIEIRDFLYRAGQLSDDADPEIDELLADYEHYMKLGIHRRTEVFLELASWPEEHLKKAPRES